MRSASHCYGERVPLRATNPRWLLGGWGVGENGRSLHLPFCRRSNRTKKSPRRTAEQRLRPPPPGPFVRSRAIRASDRTEGRTGAARAVGIRLLGERTKGGIGVGSGKGTFFKKPSKAQDVAVVGLRHTVRMRRDPARGFPKSRSGPRPPGCGSGRHRLCPGARSEPCPPRALGGVVRRSAPALRARGASSAPPCSSCTGSGTHCYCYRYPYLGSVISRTQRFDLKVCEMHGKKISASQSLLRYEHPKSFLSELVLLLWRFAPFGMGSDVPCVLHLEHVIQ